MSETPVEANAPRGRTRPVGRSKRFWPLAGVLVLLGLVAGAAYGATSSVTYRAEAQVGVGAVGAATGGAGGFSLAAQELAAQALAADYARYVTPSSGRTAIAAALGPAAASSISTVRATALPHSTIIDIRVAAGSKQGAVRAANAVQQALVTQVNALFAASTPAAVLSQYNEVNTRLVAAQTNLTAAVERLDSLRSTGAASSTISSQQAAVNAAQVATSTLSTQAAALQTQYQALLSQPPAATGLRTVTPAAYVGSNQSSQVWRYLLIGLAVGAVVALAVGGATGRRRVAVAPDPDPAPVAPAPVAPAAVASDEDAVGADMTGLERPRPHSRQRSHRRETVRMPALRRPAVRLPALRMPELRPPVRPEPVPQREPEQVAESHPIEPAAKPPHVVEPVEPREPVEPTAPATYEPGPTTNPYLVQAIRSTREQQERATAEQEAREQEARRREVRDELQRRQRESDERLAEYLRHHEEPVALAEVVEGDEAAAFADHEEPVNADESAPVAVHVLSPQPDAGHRQIRVLVEHATEANRR